MRLKAYVPAIILITSLLIGGCGNSNGGNAATPSASEPASSQTSENKTRVYKSEQGEIEIPANPQRIIAGGHLGSMIALGVKPVGAVKEWEADSPYLAGKVDGIVDIGDPHSLEVIASLNPDLIVLSYAEDIAPFSKIAPTVLIPYESLRTVDEQISVIADLLGKDKEGAEWLEQFHKNADEARAKVNAVIPEGKSAAIIGIMDGTVGLLGDRFGRGGQALYNVLKLKPPERVQKLIDGDGTVEQVSLEVLPEVVGDYIFLSTFDEKDPAKKDIVNSPVWKGLDAVKNGRMFELDHNRFYFSDPISIQGQLNLIVEMLTASK